MPKALRFAIAVAALALALPTTGQAACHLPNQIVPCQLKNGQVVAVNATFQPQSVEARLGGYVFWQNLDLVPHTVTYESDGCRDTLTTTACLFDKPLPVGALLGTAVNVKAGTAATDLPVGTYNYFCRNHSFVPGEDMVGTFVINT